MKKFTFIYTGIQKFEESEDCNCWGKKTYKTCCLNDALAQFLQYMYESRIELVNIGYVPIGKDF